MSSSDSKKDSGEFPNQRQGRDLDFESSRILAKWQERCGVSRQLILEEAKAKCSLDEGVGIKTFSQWLTNKRISSPKRSPETTGNRVVAVVRWFAEEHDNRVKPVIELEELEDFIGLYSDVPPKNLLQLRRILWTLSEQDTTVCSVSEFAGQCSITNCLICLPKRKAETFLQPGCSGLNSGSASFVVIYPSVHGEYKCPSAAHEGYQVSALV
jgi:hypothetical protein